MIRSRPALYVRFLLFLLAAPLLFAGCGDDPASPELSGDNLLELVTVSPDLELIQEIVGDLGLTATLRTGSDLTFFAPSDEALRSLGSDMLVRLQAPENQDVLDKLVRRHLVPGRFRTADLRDAMTLEPLAGPPLTVRVDDEDIFVNDARITDEDFETSNGVLHLVDEVVRDHLTLAERLRVTPIISSFGSALELAELTESFDGTPYTLFLPINSAFDNVGAGVLPLLRAPGNRDVLGRVLRHHIVSGRVRADDLTDGAVLSSLDGSPLTVRAEDGLLYLGDARVIIPEIETSDGLIYLLDTVELDFLSIAERLRIVPELETLQTILSDAGLADELANGEGFTVFGPTDATLAEIGSRFATALRERPDLLLRTAQHYVAPSRIEPAELLNETPVTTLGGTELAVRVQPETSTGRPNIILGVRGVVALPPIEASNGLIYLVEPFLLPPNLNLEERAVFEGLFEFLDEMERAGLTDLLRSEGPYTIFGPTDAAFDDVIIFSGLRQRILEYHIVEGLYDIAAFAAVDSLILPTLIGSELVVYDRPPAGIYVVGESDSLRVIGGNDFATNGVIHPLNGVLMPPMP